MIKGVALNSVCPIPYPLAKTSVNIIENISKGFLFKESNNVKTIITVTSRDNVMEIRFIFVFLLNRLFQSLTFRFGRKGICLKPDQFQPA